LTPNYLSVPEPRRRTNTSRFSSCRAAGGDLPETVGLLTVSWWPVGNLSPICPLAGHRIPPEKNTKQAAVGGPFLPMRR